MRDVVKGALLFAAVYVAWQLFWRTTFALYDLVGPIVTWAILIWLGRWFLGSEGEPLRTSDSPQETVSHNPPTPLYKDKGFLEELRKLEDRRHESWRSGLLDRRIERNLSKHSPLLAQKYAEKASRAQQHSDSAVVDLDEAISRLSNFYLRANSLEREEIRNQLGAYPTILKNLHMHAGRALQAYRRTGVFEKLTLALAAIAMDNERGYKFYESTLAAICVAIVDAGRNPKVEFGAIAALCDETSAEGLAALLRNFEDTRTYEKEVIPQLVRRSAHS